MLRVLSRLLVVTVACLAVASVGFGAEKEKKEKKGGGERGKFNVEEMFKRLDTNKDGKVSCDEFVANPRYKGKKDQAMKAFEKMGGSKDKALTLEEFKEGFKKLMADRTKGEKKGEGKRKKEGGSK